MKLGRILIGLLVVFLVFLWAWGFYDYRLSLRTAQSEKANLVVEETDTPSSILATTEPASTVLQGRASTAYAILDSGDIKGFYDYAVSPLKKQQCPYGQWVTMGTFQNQEEFLSSTYQRYRVSVVRVESAVVYLSSHRSQSRQEVVEDVLRSQTWGYEEGNWWVIDPEWFKGC